MSTTEPYKDFEDIKTQLPNDLKESIKTNFKKGGEDLHKPMASEPLQKNVDVINRENL